MHCARQPMRLAAAGRVVVVVVVVDWMGRASPPYRKNRRAASASTAEAAAAAAASAAAAAAAITARLARQLALRMITDREAERTLSKEVDARAAHPPSVLATQRGRRPSVSGGIVIRGSSVFASDFFLPHPGISSRCTKDNAPMAARRPSRVALRRSVRAFPSAGMNRPVSPPPLRFREAGSSSLRDFPPTSRAR